jgi:hypothetical protein
MIQVVLSWPNHVRKEVVLAGVPRIGEHIRLSDAEPDEASLAVEYVLWLEGSNGKGNTPTVIVCVRSHVGGPDV